MQLVYFSTPSLFSGLKVQLSADQSLKNLHHMSTPAIIFGGSSYKIISPHVYYQLIDMFCASKMYVWPNSDYICNMQGEEI